jgi:hypothetical protein
MLPEKPCNERLFAAVGEAPGVAAIDRLKNDEPRSSMSAALPRSDVVDPGIVSLTISHW